MASGLLTGKFSASTTFDKDDHRAPIRNKEVFSNNEAFAGLDYRKGLEAVEELKNILGTELKLSALALKWILMFPEVSCVIPGASSPDQVLSNIHASELLTLSLEQIGQIKRIYETHISPNLATANW